MQEPIQAFPDDVRAEFYRWIGRPEHTNRARMSHDKRRILRMFLRKPDLKPSNKMESGFRTLVHKYRLDNDPTSNTLWRLRDSGHSQDRKVIPEDLSFDTITRMHCQHAHPGKNKTFDLVRERYYGITKEEVAWVIKHCRICSTNRTGSSRPPSEPIIVHNVFERVQMDLIDMRMEKDDIYNWILHLKDHFSKYSFLRPLTSKGARQVATELEYWIQLMGPPRLIQCNNGKEFKSDVLHLLQRYGIKLINSNSRHPQSQGSVEQGNSTVIRKLRALMAERGTREWSTLLVEVSIAMNSEVHETLRLTPYEAVFHQQMRIDNWIPMEEREQEMLGIAQDEQSHMLEDMEEDLENTSEIDNSSAPPFAATGERDTKHLASNDKHTRDGNSAECIEVVHGNHNDIVQPLVENSTLVKARDTSYTDTPLHLSARGGHADIVELLLEEGTPVDAIGEIGNTPLHSAASNGHSSIVELLLGKGASVGAMNEFKTTPLHYAAAVGNIGIVELLISRGAPIGALNVDNKTPLHFAARESDTIDVVELLISRGVLVDALTRTNKTPLHIAAKHSTTDMVELLIGRGASIDALTRKNETPLHIAAKCGNTDIVKLLISKGAKLFACKDNS